MGLLLFTLLIVVGLILTYGGYPLYASRYFSRSHLPCWRRLPLCFSNVARPPDLIGILGVPFLVVGSVYQTIVWNTVATTLTSDDTA